MKKIKHVCTYLVFIHQIIVTLHFLSCSTISVKTIDKTS